MTIEMTDTVCRARDLMSAPVDDDLVILSLAGNCYVALDPVGRRVLEMIETPVQVGALCRRLSEEFDATEGEIAGDVRPFLAELHGEGIVDVVDDGSH